ncbi:hypothetical protein C900_03955 [Fulvivirga imtechensis AK7]|uniref:Uncharacterized protein n=1 Tax=Fulvivirga imtechensis AK7 TaxID=1237149 RepID=L8JN83_9BACT|nr:hypothetical protein C900_03955 [Fulvivirga imtechensis AK7]
MGKSQALPSRSRYGEARAVSKWLNFNACDDKSQTHPVKNGAQTV